MPDEEDHLDWIVRAECLNGHTQEITIRNVSRLWAESWAGLMDGTSDLYVHKPGPASVIGKCGICGQQIACTVRPAQTTKEIAT